MKLASLSKIENTSLHNYYAQEKDFCCMKLLSKGRIGRVQYLLCSMGITFFGLVLVGLLSLIPIVGVPLAVMYFAGMMVFNLLLTIQRCHDINISGWLGLISFIPLLSSSLYFISGTSGTNHYGRQPSPCSTEAKAAVYALASVAILGLVLAFSLLDNPQIGLFGNKMLVALVD